MSPEMWKKEYFPFTEYTLEMPTVKINLHKQMLFIVNDYLDYYVRPLANYKSYLSEIKHMSVNKQAVKQAKLRQIIFNRLLEDYKLGETLKVCISELKTKYSLTKMMQIVDISCHGCDVYVVRNDNGNSLIPLMETQVIDRQKKGGRKGIENWLDIKAQLPLLVDSNSTYVPGEIEFKKP